MIVLEKERYEEGKIIACRNSAPERGGTEESKEVEGGMKLPPSAMRIGGCLNI